MSPLEFVRLLDEVNSPAVGIWFDIGNVVAVGYPEQWVRILGGKRLVGIHIKDFKRGPGDHFGTYDGFVPLFHGSVNWPTVMCANSPRSVSTTTLSRKLASATCLWPMHFARYRASSTFSSRWSAKD